CSTFVTSPANSALDHSYHPSGGTLRTNMQACAPFAASRSAAVASRRRSRISSTFIDQHLVCLDRPLVRVPCQIGNRLKLQRNVDVAVFGAAADDPNTPQLRIG